MTATIEVALAILVSRYGFRVSSVNCRRAGIPERFLFDAVTAGRARIERTYRETGESTYLIFA